MFFLIRQILINIFRHVWHDGCHGVHESLKDVMQYCLTGPATCDIVQGRNIKPILGHIKVKVTQIGRRKSEHSLCGGIELIIIVMAFHFCQYRTQTSQNVLIQRWQLIVRNEVFGGIKIMQITNDIPSGIAQFAIRFKRLFDNVVTNTDVARVVDGSDPHSQNIRTVGGFLLFIVTTLNNLERINDISQTLGHFETFLVQDEPVRQYSFVWCLATSGDTG
mmetsp:Transcript_5560/g.8796  ORF Transcript_5560/g.8796 Transcript_5560/m.8796 type:complete len:220 (-) Transcript_5560:2037-2696(-)